MITPVFHLTQEGSYLLVKIRAPHCKLHDAELFYDERSFIFHAKPYFLRLYLPADVVDDEQGTCGYDADQGIFTIRVPKKNPGEHFSRLELINELLRPPREAIQPSAGNLVEVLNEFEESEVKDEEVSVEAVQTLSNEAEEPSTSVNFDALSPNEFGYGFGWLRHGILDRFRDEIGDLIELDLPDETSISHRLKRLHEFDIQRFQAQHYLADLFSPEQAQLEALDFEPDDGQLFELSEADRVDLKDMRMRNFNNFSSELIEQIAFSLLDILFGFLYDYRTTLGEHNVESGWTISKLSPSLTFLVCWPSVREAVRCTVRHSLVIPLYRNWELSLRVFRDVERVLAKGNVAILHCLLGARRLFNKGGEFRYLFNQLIMDELCLWIQTISDDQIKRLWTELKAELNKLSKAYLLEELDLDTIEVEARMAEIELLDSDDEKMMCEND